MIGLVCAMENELALVRASFPYTRVLGTLSGLGKVNAALATDALIREGAGCIINIGVAGALDPSLRLGDTVLCSEISYHDVWCGAPNAPGQVQGLPQRFHSDERLVEAASRVLPGARVGLAVSGDQFVTDPSKVEAIRAAFTDALCVDMESAAIAQTCYLRNVPLLSVKIMSDSGDDQEYAAFWDTIAQRSFDTIQPLLKLLCDTQ